MQNGQTVRVALIGVGNCASSLVQGLEFYRTAGEDEFVPGLMHVNLGGYHVREVEFSAAFGVVEGKVGHDLSGAILASPNNTIKFADVPKLSVRVHRGMTHDGLGEYVSTKVQQARGVRLDRTYQLNSGGNMHFYNMLERTQLESKKISKTGAVTSQLDYALPADAVHVGPSDYVPWLTDRKWAYIRMEGTTFGNVPLNVEVKMEVWDSPNSAGVVIDAARCAKLALDRGIAGPLEGPSAYLMKTPPKQYTDDQARQLIEDFIGGSWIAAPQLERRARESLHGRAVGGAASRDPGRSITNDGDSSRRESVG